MTDDCGRDSGASRGDVLRTVERQGLALGGTAVGAGGALLLSWLMPGEAGGPADVCRVWGVLGVVTLAAACVPACRATRIDPVSALRCE